MFVLRSAAPGSAAPAGATFPDFEVCTLRGPHLQPRLELEEAVIQLHDWKLFAVSSVTIGFLGPGSKPGVLELKSHILPQHCFNLVSWAKQSITTPSISEQESTHVIASPRP